MVPHDDYNLDLLDGADIRARAILTDIIGAADPVRALAKLLLLRDNGGDKGQIHARATFRAAGKDVLEAEIETAKLIAEIWPEDR